MGELLPDVRTELVSGGHLDWDLNEDGTVTLSVFTEENPAIIICEVNLVILRDNMDDLMEMARMEGVDV